MKYNSLSPFITVKQHYARLKETLKRKPDEVYIATYNVYAGIGADGVNLSKGKHNLVMDFLNRLKKVKKVKILIGFPRKNNSESDNQFNLRKRRLLATAKNWPQFDWRFRYNTHMKCVGFSKNGKSMGCIGGGRNLTDSTYTDVSFVLPRKSIPGVKKLFNSSFSSATKITKSALKL